MDVFIVTTGEYSDYGIDSVWLDRGLADQRVLQLAANGASYPDVSVYEASTVLPRVYSELHIFLDPRDGSTRTWTTSVTLWGSRRLTKEQRCCVREAGTPRLSVSGVDHDRVRKVFSEQLTQLRAREEGLT